jgi:3-oxoadipate enol-lactonase
MTVPILTATVEGNSATLAGRDDVLILGPSLGSTTRSWDGALAELSEEHTIVRWDLPGHGASQPARVTFTLAELATAVINLADALGIDRFDYAGVSVAGAVALELAIAYPARLKHVIPICTAAKLGEPGPWNERAELVRAEGASVVIPVQEERWFSPEFREEDAPIVAETMSDIAAADGESYALLCEAIGQYDVREKLSTISVPLLMISGECDPATTVDAGAFIASHVPGGTQYVVPGAFHQAIVEHPLLVARAMNAFLSGKALPR